ncbi:MAG: hypothetical protein KDK90_15245 [Leptospiraceae bacterium]|nr:hypothetical protein [Leptospiraceae bacterium]
MPETYVNPAMWDEKFDSFSNKERYDFVMETLQQPLTPKFVEELDLGFCIGEVLDELNTNNLVENALELIQKFKYHQSELYKEEYPFFDYFLVEYYLFQKEPEKLEEALSRFKIDPEKGIEPLLSIMDMLIYYGYIDTLQNLIDQTYLVVRDSEEIIGGAQYDFAQIIFHNLVNKIYNQTNNGSHVDWNFINSEISKYGYDHKKMRDISDKHLMSPIQGGEEFEKNFRNNRIEIFESLMWSFCIYMYTEKNMNFICSANLWNGIITFLEGPKSKHNKKQPAEIYFDISKHSLEHYISGLYGGIMSLRQAKAIAILWGLTYFYDFLISKKLISNSIFNKAKRSIEYVKNAYIQTYQRSLWKYNFVHRWKIPDSISYEEFESEAKIFAESIKIQIPLNCEPENDFGEL